MAPLGTAILASEREAVVEDGGTTHQPWTAQLQTYMEEKCLTH